MCEKEDKNREMTEQEQKDRSEKRVNRKEVLEERTDRTVTDAPGYGENNKREVTRG